MSFWEDYSYTSVFSPTTVVPSMPANSVASAPLPSTLGSSPLLRPGDNTLLMERLGRAGFDQWMDEHPDLPRVPSVPSSLPINRAPINVLDPFTAPGESLRFRSIPPGEPLGTSVFDSRRFSTTPAETAVLSNTDTKAALLRAVNSQIRLGEPLNATTLSSSMGSPNPRWDLSSAGPAITSIREGLTSNDPLNEPNELTTSNSLQAASRRGDPVLSYEWVALIVDPANPMTIEPIYVESLQAPNISFDQKMKFADGANLSYAGAMSVGQMSITLMADAYGKAFKLANNWIFSIYDQESGGFYAPSDYKKSVKLFVHDARKGVIVQFDFLGVWPVSWNGHTWNQTSDPAPVQLSLSVDRVRISGASYWTDL